MSKQGKQASMLHGNCISVYHNQLFSPVTLFVLDGIGQLYLCFAGIPDFAEVYSFIGSVFDPDTDGHVQKLKEMDPINFETVSKNLPLLYLS